MSLIKRLHGILFVAGSEGVTAEQLATTFNLSIEEILQALNELKLKLQQDSESPIELVNYNHYYRLSTVESLGADVEAFAISPMMQTLSRAAVETLAIIAYRQPITRMGIDEIRGVQSSGMIQRLLLRDLIKEVGRVEAPGRPVLYGTTHYFMDYFGLETLEQLPAIEPLELHGEQIDSTLFSTKQWEIEFFEETGEE